MVADTWEGLRQNWWGVALQGLAAMVFGIVTWAWPGITLVVLLALFGAYVLIDGLIALFSGFTIRSWALILAGFAGIWAGIITFLYPGITGLVLLAVIAAWAIITGCLEVLVGIELRRAIANEWLIIVSGVISVIFGIFLAAHSSSGALAVVWLIGAYAILVGMGRLALAYRLRS
jgi:uncharacterized membrane protein HdeD (DUF308 family)